MRSKKLARQLKKSLECEEVDDLLPAAQEWLNGAGAAANPPEVLKFLAQNMGPLLDAVEASYEQYETNLTHAQRSLELSGQEVEARNKLLRFEVKKVSDLLNNMRQAVFSVEGNGNIVAPVSRFAGTVFAQDLPGKNIYDVVYPHLDPKGEEIANLRSAMIGVFGDGELQWELMEAYFPRRATMYLPGAEPKEENLRILKIAVGPIWGETMLLERLMFIVEDVTEVEKLERRMAEEKAKANRNMQIIQEMVGVSRANCADFLARSTEMLVETHAVLSKPEHPDFDWVFRQLHTIKGNSRGYKFGLISGAAHRVESLAAECRGAKSQENWAKYKEEIFVEMAKLQDQVKEYADLAQSVLGISPAASAGGAGGGPSDGGQMQKLIEKLRPLVNGALDLKNPAMREIKTILDRANDVPVTSGLERMSHIVQDLATELGKAVDVVIKEEEGLMVAPDVWNTVQDALVHIVRNAVDHGIEEQSERKDNGKPSPAKVSISCARDPKGLCVVIEDDGRGLDPAYVADKAVALGLADKAAVAKMSEKEKLQLIFAAGYTSKTEVTDISGRGAGLDAVRAIVEQVGGTIELNTTKGLGCKFTIVFNGAPSADVGAA